MCRLYFYLLIFVVSLLCIHKSNANDIIFNTDLLDVSEKQSIDSGIFSKAGYVFPGKYTIQLVVNDVFYGERTVYFYNIANNNSALCLTSDLIKDFGLKKNVQAQLLSSRVSNPFDMITCYDQSLLNGIKINSRLNKDTLNISIPQAYRDYVGDYWDGPSRWDDGVDGAFFDYSLSLRGKDNFNGRKLDMSSYGIMGTNIGKWRFRTEWQANYLYEFQKSSYGYYHINRLYSYRALPDITAKLMIGEQYMDSSLFDGFQFIGSSIISDDNMLPPELKGYAPEVIGIAKSNAKVTISHQGEIIYQTQVPSGPFKIQDIGSGVSGQLDVKIEEQDGSIQMFKINTATVPYLSRPGSLRYKFNSGKVGSDTHIFNGPLFGSAEFSWGVSNNWTLFGGTLLSEDYSAFSIGSGRDLMGFGAISFDITHSLASVLGDEKLGSSYRINYSKSFDEVDSQIAFSAAHYPDPDFMNMNEYIYFNESGSNFYDTYEGIYTVFLNKKFRDHDIGVYVNYTHRKYKSSINDDNISISFSHYFDLFKWQGLALSLTAYNNSQENKNDTGIYLNFSFPLGPERHLNYSMSSTNGFFANNVGLFEKIDNRNNYSVTVSESKVNNSISGFYTHVGDKNTVMVNMNHQTSGSTVIGLTVNGGVTTTKEGISLHRVSVMGSSRIMVDTDGVGDVPISAGGLNSMTNHSGKTVLADIPSYYRHKTSIDIDNLNNDVDTINSPISSRTLTEGAIGYVHFDMLSGSKRMLQLVRSDGKPLPFSSEVFNGNGIKIGMVSDDGMTYISGLHDGMEAIIHLDNDQHCRITLPTPLPQPDETRRITCYEKQEK
ncbi:fimbria/pilus outer membrane usher protein [Vibrio cholerae]